MLVQLSKRLVAIGAALPLIAVAWGQASQTESAKPEAAQAAKPEEAKKNWKDRAEYDLYANIAKETDPAKRLQLLDQWKQKYANTDFKMERLQFYMSTYQQLNQGTKLLETAKEVIKEDPKNITALYWINLFTISLNNTAPDALQAGEDAAKSLLSNLDEAFSPAKKPANVADADFQKQRAAVEAAAHNTLGWVAMTRKNNEEAEKHFTESLKVDPNNGQVSYWLGTVILAQKVPEKQAQALYHFARASSYRGPNALPDQARTQLDTYLQKVYTQYHGDQSGLAEIKQQAATQPFPPADFKIKSAAEIATEKEEEFRKTNPMLALWMSIKKELASDNGETYFENRMKNAHIPGGVLDVQKFRGKVISQTPARRPSEIVVGIADATNAEVTLKLDQPMPNPAPEGTEIAFDGVAQSFTREPSFNLTLAVEKNNIEGWPAPAAPARKGGAKGAKKK